ncbi:MAG: AmmeMemoRadiSam system protein B [Bacteroidales bacterium]|nr:AmmeMemoRadiSam system protein B [Bacteroidales bacterium]
MQNTNLINRKPVVAGQFYPGRPDELKAELIRLFADAVPRQATNDVLAIISPHAGYVFSGPVSASSFNQIDPRKKYNTVFVIGSSHRTMFDGASIYNKGHYETPLGIVKVDLETANLLINKNDVFTYRSDAHDYEHSLEVQLPFLQYILETDYKIVPVVIATQNRNTVKKIAEALKPYFTKENLFVISTDFSHYPEYEDAVKVDKATADAIVTGIPEEFLSTLRKNEQKRIPNLATSICGWTSVLALMYITEVNPGIKYVPVDYKNSGDAKHYGDKSRVVGYYSIAVYAGNDNPAENKSANQAENSDLTLSAKDKQKLLEISRNTLEQYIRTGKIPVVKDNELSDNIKTCCGAFVSLHINGKLRGCIGNFSQDIPLYKVVQEMTVSSATRDYRFAPVEADDLSKIDIEISVLTPLKRIESIDEIEPGRHGIYIRKGARTGTFLPQVGTQTGWDLEDFLGHCARDKAGIGWDGWKDAELFTYEAIVFSEHEMK